MTTEQELWMNMIKGLIELDEEYEKENAMNKKVNSQTNIGGSILMELKDNYLVNIKGDTLTNANKSILANANKSILTNANKSILTNAKVSGYFNPAMYIGIEAQNPFYIKKVIYNNPATIVFWSDGTKTVSKCSKNDHYSKECGLSICVLKKICGREAKNILTEWTDTDNKYIDIKEVLKKYGK